MTRQEDRNVTDYWFKPKTHGYGAYPSNWKGWAATFGFVVVVTLVSVWMLWPDENGGIGWVRIGLCVVVEIVLTLGFVWLCKVKTDGPWRWRWGEKE